jgi:nucleoside-triphosphatase THEP1
MQHYQYKPLNTVWLKASVIGSIWASVEIILGSFLHNLKVPLTGALLSFIGVYLLTAFTQIWNEKGIIWRAGLICALMKSISPSAVILGPMIGIFMEAALIEIFVRLLGRNLPAYSIGGGLAVLSTIIQAAAGLVILYGFNFVKILASLYKFSLKQINFPQISAYYLILLIALIYITAGVSAAVAGYLTGRRYLVKENRKAGFEEINLKAKEKLFTISGRQRYSVWFLALNIIAIILCLFLININFSYSSVLVVFAYLLFCVNNYRHSIKHILKFSFWIQFLLITLGAGYFLNGITQGSLITIDGLITGLKMNLRAVVIIFGFSAISAELRNPLIKSVLFKRGFANIYQSLSLAFSALPGVVATLPGSRDLLKQPFNSFVNLVGKADSLLNAFQKEAGKNPLVFIISGGVHKGKTTFAGEVARFLKMKGINSGGFLALGIDEDGKRKGFELLNLSDGVRVKLCSNAGNDDWVKIGNYYFHPEGVEQGNSILLAENLKEADIVFVDEIGPLEMDNSGWAKSIDELCKAGNIPQVWVMREALVERAVKKWSAADAYVFNIESDTPASSAEFIEKKLAGKDA